MIPIVRMPYARQSHLSVGRGQPRKRLLVSLPHSRPYRSHYDEHFNEMHLQQVP